MVTDPDACNKYTPAPRIDLRSGLQQPPKAVCSGGYGSSETHGLKQPSLSAARPASATPRAALWVIAKKPRQKAWSRRTASCDTRTSLSASAMLVYPAMLVSRTLFRSPTPCDDLVSPYINGGVVSSGMMIMSLILIPSMHSTTSFVVIMSCFPRDL